MRDILRVTWTVTPSRPPEPWRHCSRCNGTRRFRSSGKFRANSQKQRIDVWLIYSCEICQESWNLPILERAAVGGITTSQLAGFTHNDPALTRRYAFDLVRLKRYSPGIEACSELAVAKAHVSGRAYACESNEITLCLPEPNELRLDAFQARELGLSRSAVAQLAEADLLSVLPRSRRGMRIMFADGQIVTFDLGRVDGDTSEILIHSALEPASQGSP